MLIHTVKDKLVVLIQTIQFVIRLFNVFPRSLFLVGLNPQQDRYIILHLENKVEREGALPSRRTFIKK